MGWDLRDESFEAILFDHDGTLVDTMTGDYLAFRDLFQEFGLSLSISRWASTACRDVAASTVLFDEIVAACGQPVRHEDLRRRLEHHGARYLVAPQVTLMPGVIELLTYLREADVPMGVATAAPRKWALKWLDHFEIRSFFKNVSSGRECARNKPDPDVYLRAAEELGVPPGACLVFEDSMPGALAAKAAGMRVVAVPMHFARDLEFAMADVVIDGLASALPPADGAPRQRQNASRGR